MISISLASLLKSIARVLVDLLLDVSRKVALVIERINKKNKKEKENNQFLLLPKPKKQDDHSKR
jgi:hypothetical protein